MGKCRYCGAEAGFLRGRHGACEADHRAAVAEITQCCWTAVTGSYDPALAREWVEARAPEGWISDPRPFFLKAWGDAVRKILDEGVLGLAEQERLNLVRETFDLAPAELGEAWLLRCQGIAIREVLEGRVPAPGQDFHVPFGVQQAERIVWAWSAVKHYRERTRPTFPEARPEKSPGVAGGVYHTLRAARAEAAAPTGLTLVGVGTLVFTDQNLYWGSAGWKAVRIPWKKVAAVRPFADGIGITKEGDPAMPMVFVIGETQGWLAWNLAENLPNLG